MVEVDVVLRGGDGEPILAHPPDTDSDITLQEWLAQMGSTNKGIKLDFKSLAAVGPSLELLGQLGQCLDRPVWLNGDILPGPRGSCAPLDARAFLGAVTSSCPDATLSLGWTTGCHREQGKGRAPWLPWLQQAAALAISWLGAAVTVGPCPVLGCGTERCAALSAALGGESHVFVFLK
uniref:Family with sequence similarity 151 member B n=1 Tax=Serinus canaria TaxID=9135 RepID=A0A8C9UDG1_SERCA